MENILCEHWGLFSATFPTSGMMRGGKLYPLPPLAHRTVESEFLLLRTPTTMDSKSSNNPETAQKFIVQNRQVSLSYEIALLRTPVASEAEGGAMHPDDAKAGGNTLKLGWQLLALGGHINPKLPTPTVSDQYTDNLASSQQSDGSMHSVTLAQIVNRPDLLPTPQVDDSKNTGHNENRRPTLASEVYGQTEWGKFAPAIHQWETITGNPAPPPTIPDGRDGQARLNPQFAEWMMGLPPGWITDCNITRNEQLKACGNGVVPQQATLAITRLLQGVTL